MSCQIDLANAGMIENLRADSLIGTARAVYTAPGLAWEQLEQARWALTKARTRAEGVGAIAYDRDKVQSSSYTDMSDRVGSVLELELAKTEAERNYTQAVFSFRYCLLMAYEMGLFNPLQVQMWKTYYEHGHGPEDLSLQRLADIYGVTKRRAQYLVTEPRTISQFCQAVERCMTTLEMNSERAYNINTPPFAEHPCA